MFSTKRLRSVAFNQIIPNTVFVDAAGISFKKRDEDSALPLNLYVKSELVVFPNLKEIVWVPHEY